MSGWRVLIPVKALATAKTRTGLDPEWRRELTLAMLRDVVASVRRTAHVDEVAICTGDPQLLDELPHEAIWLTSGRGGLNAELSEALGDPWAQASGQPTAVVVADLPCLTARDLSRVLALAAQGLGALVASCDGGTTILAARDPHRLTPRFGKGSATEHRRWYRDVTASVGTGCRLDVDTIDALSWGHRVGLGPRTAYLVQALGGIDRLREISTSKRSAGRR